MSHRLQVLIPEDLNARIRKAAQRARLSKGEWVRRSIESSLTRSSGEDTSTSDPLSQLCALDGPVADIEQMLDEIDAGRQ